MSSSKKGKPGDQVKKQDNYNSLKTGEKKTNWGNTGSPNGRTITKFYGDVAVPEVNTRSQDVGKPTFNYDSKVGLKTYNQGYTPIGGGYKVESNRDKDSLFGNEKYETLGNNLKTKVDKDIDVQNALAGKGRVAAPSMLSAESSVIGSPSAVFIGVLVGAGITFAALSLRRSLTDAEEPLLTVI